MSEKFREKILNSFEPGYELSREDAICLAGLEDEASVSALAEKADQARTLHRGDAVDLCSIVSARSGNCELSCAFCSQSAESTANIDIFDMKSVEDILKAARSAEEYGAHRFCIVTSGVKVTDSDLNVACEAIQEIKKTTALKSCASMGVIDKKQAGRLKAAGLDRYHNNLESSRKYYAQISAAGLYDEKIRTLKDVKSLGLEICTGGILGMGESPEDRIELAFELKALDPDSVPVNIFRPFVGSLLSDIQPLDLIEAVKYISIFRLILPNAWIRLGAGRERTFGSDISPAFRAGANGLLIGDYLTVKGSNVDDDLSRLASMGFRS